MIRKKFLLGDYLILFQFLGKRFVQHSAHSTVKFIRNRIIRFLKKITFMNNKIISIL
jgi:hypothetical protein